MNRLIQKVSTDLYVAQMKWVAWFLPSVYLVYVLILTFLNEPEIRAMSLLTFTFQTTTIFLLVCGILSCWLFLPWYVKHGIPRKVYFQATLLSAIGLSITIITITAFVTFGLTLLGDYTSLFDEVVLSSIAESNWVLTILAYILVAFIYFLAGWVISLGFYRYGGSGGFVSIIISVLFIFLNDLLWNLNTPKPIVGIWSIEFPSINIAISFLGSILLVIIAGTIIQKKTSDVPIKVG